MSTRLEAQSADALILELLKNNPDVARDLLRASGAVIPTDSSNPKVPAKKSYAREKGSSDYILTTISICLLCRSIDIEHRRLSWDSEKGCYRSALVPIDMPEVLPIKLSRIEHPSCDKCRSVLFSLEKDTLVDLCKTLHNAEKTILRDLETKKILFATTTEGK